jgi:hypothetical protein
LGHVEIDFDTRPNGHLLAVMMPSPPEHPGPVAFPMLLLAKWYPRPNTSAASREEGRASESVTVSDVRT